METKNNIQVLDATGFNLFVTKLKDGTLVVGKAGSVDAANINGNIPLNKLPAAALERITIVATESARLALTKDDVQNGDSVKVTETNKMYAVVDGTKLGTENAANAFTDYVVGSAAKAALADAVPWSGITDKPAAFTPESHTHTPGESGVEAIPDATIEAIISGTWNPNDNE